MDFGSRAPSGKLRETESAPSPGWLLSYRANKLNPIKFDQLSCKNAAEERTTWKHR